MPGTTWAKEMNFIMNHAPGAGLIIGLFDIMAESSIQYTVNYATKAVTLWMLSCT